MQICHQIPSDPRSHGVHDGEGSSGTPEVKDGQGIDAEQIYACEFCMSSTACRVRWHRGQDRVTLFHLLIHFR